MLKKILIAFAVLCVLVACAAYYFLRTTEPAADCSFALDATAMRALANAIPGDKPSDIRTDRVASFHFPRAVISTGEAFSTVDMDVFVYQLVYGDGTVLIDTAMDEQDTKDNMGDNFDQAAWARVVEAMKKAKAIYVTHEHGDHIGGLLHVDAWTRAQLSKEQREPGDRLNRPMPAAAQTAPLLEYEGMKALAPGLVAVKAPGHTPGSQMFFVQRADGRELLLIGDVAWQMFAIERESPQPRVARLIGKYFDLRAIACQLVALNRLRKSEPIAIMPGHDGNVMTKLLADGLMHRPLQ